MRNHFKNSFNASHAKPWKLSGLERARPSPLTDNPAAIKSNDSFTAPLGYMTKQIKCCVLTSVFKDVEASELGGARVLEYYEYATQSVSILIVLPSDNILGLPSIKEEVLEANFPSVFERLQEKRMSVVLPSKLYEHLEKAKLSKRSRMLKSWLKKASDSEAKSDVDIPVGEAFRVNGPFIIVMYDKISKRVLGTNRIYQPGMVSVKMRNMIYKYKQLDKSWLAQALKAAKKPANAEQPSDEKPSNEQSAVASAESQHHSSNDISEQLDELFRQANITDGHSTVSRRIPDYGTASSRRVPDNGTASSRRSTRRLQIPAAFTKPY